MPSPTIEVVPLRKGVCSDAPVVLDILIRITPPMPEVHILRPPINLGLVLDRSGSMGSEMKMEHAIDAALYAVEQLLPSDRVSVTIFDEVVETIVPNTTAQEKRSIIERMRTVTARGSTALAAGWSEGSDQVGKHFVQGGLNRVLLLSDGLANVGLTDPNAIAGNVEAAARLGISTSTMGVGRDYNEDLMEAMATGGDGNYYFIETPKQLADIFQTEMQGLMATTGHHVSLGVEPADPAISISDVLNDFAKTSHGRLMLPNLVIGMPVNVVIRLAVPPRTGTSVVCRFRVAWDEPRQTTRIEAWSELELPAIPHGAWERLPDDPVVEEQVALLMSARAKQEAARAMEQHDMAAAREHLMRSRRLAEAFPGSPLCIDELAAIGRLEADLAEGDFVTGTKRSKQQAWAARQARRKA
jgi:Ca-activated chloride channel family protein